MNDVLERELERYRQMDDKRMMLSQQYRTDYIKELKARKEFEQKKLEFQKKLRLSVYG